MFAAKICFSLHYDGTNVWCLQAIQLNLTRIILINSESKAAAPALRLVLLGLVA
jgi:hypothetical protein